MSTTDSAGRYSRGAIILHWVIALMIVGNFIGAWTAEDLPRDQKIVIMGYHKASGILIMLLTLVRIGWRLTHRPPALAETLKAWEAALARVTHSLFYFLMIAVPVAGWGLHSAYGKGKPVSIFGLFDFPALPVGSDKPTIGVFGDLHENLAIVMLVLAALHVLGALKHQFLDRDGTLARMLPFLR
jgi:cytochrome b561